MLKVGLTGGIGSGKSTVADLFAELGVPVIDTDVISHQLGRTPEVIAEIRDNFGDEVIDSNDRLDRRKLAGMIFDDSGKRETLERILHPRIRDEVARQCERNVNADYVVIVVPLLLETDFHQRVDRILVVDISEQEQLRRVGRRDGRAEQAIRAIMYNQLSRQERLARADDVIDNNGAPGNLRIRIDELHDYYRELAQVA